MQTIDGLYLSAPAHIENLMEQAVLKYFELHETPMVSGFENINPEKGM